MKTGFAAGPDARFAGSNPGQDVLIPYSADPAPRQGALTLSSASGSQPERLVPAHKRPLGRLRVLRAEQPFTPRRALVRHAQVKPESRRHLNQ
jgi:hypothetical protein